MTHVPTVFGDFVPEHHGDCRWLTERSAKRSYVAALFLLLAATTGIVAAPLTTAPARADCGSYD